jgi:anti-sigma factor RsiW
MRCETNYEVLMAYLDGELDPLERGRLAEHIVACESCRRTVNDLRSVSGALAKWVAPEPAALPTAGDLLERAGIQRPAPASAPPAPSLWRRWGAAAALVAIATTIGLVGINQLGDSSQEVAKTPTTSTPAPVAPPASAPSTITENDSAGQGTIGRLTDETANTRQRTDAPAEKDGAVASGTTAPEGPGRLEPPPPPPPDAAPKADAPAVAQPQPAPAPADAERAAGEPVTVTAGEEAKREAAPPRPAASKAARANGQRIRSANVTLAVGDTARTVDEIDAAARAAAGSTSGRGSTVRRRGRTQTIVIVRVPVERFEETYARIRALGSVTSEMQSSRDIDDRLQVTEDAKERQALVDEARMATIRVTVVDRQD